MSLQLGRFISEWGFQGVD